MGDATARASAREEFSDHDPEKEAARRTERGWI